MSTWSYTVEVASADPLVESDDGHILDHAARAVARLKEQFKSKEGVESLLNSLAEPAQGVEDALWQLYTERSIDVAVGVQLDALGAIVGQERGGMTDDDYRRHVRARIAANRSSGTVEDVIRVLVLVVNDEDAVIEIDPQPPAAYVARVNGVAVDPTVAAIASDFLYDATSAGVRPILEYSENEPADTFTFDVGTSGTELDAGLFADAIAGG